MEQNDIYIEEVTNFSQEIADAVRKLVKQLDTNFQELSDDDLKGIIASEHTHLYLARLKEDQRIVGMITLVVYRIPYKMKAQLEDIVVDENMRGKGAGKMLLNFAIDKAKEFGVKSLNFTSSKKDAQKFYEHLGFEKRDTNVYRLSL